MPTTIDSLQIEIQSSSTNASRGIRDLAKSLGELKASGTVSVAIKNLNNLSTALRNFTDASNATRSVGKLVGALAKLKEVGSVTKIGNSLTKLSTSLNALDKVKVDHVAPQILRIVDAVAPLSSVKAGGLNTMVNAMSKIGKVTADLNDNKIAAFADRIAKLNTVLEPLSNKMTTIQAGLKGINSAARSAGTTVRKMGEDVDAASVNMASFIYTVQEAIHWIQAAVQKFSEFIAEAIEWDGVAARFGRGFGPQAQETYEWIQRLNEEMGINIQQFMQYSSIYATMLTGFGVAHEDATKMALGYTELSYDIWAGYNDVYKTFEEVSEAVKSAIAGEVEPIRRAGFTIIESTLQQTAANHGLSISLDKATEAEKSYLRYLTLVDQAHSQNLVGTYAQELNTAEGMMRTFSQQLKSLTQAFGSLFLPILVKVMPYLQAFVDLLTEAVHWVAALFGIKIQSVDFSNSIGNYETGSEAIDQVADSATGATDALGSAAKAAKELKNATLGIDELNVISPTSPTGGSSGGGSGGAGGGGVGGGGGFDGLDVDSLWDESIFAGIQNQVDEIKRKLEAWMPVLATIAGSLAALSLASLLKNIGDALAGMNTLEKIFASVAILTIEAALVFTFADNYLESGNLLFLIGEALVTAVSGYLMFKAWGPAGAALALGVSIAAQLIALKMNLADGTVDLSSKETWLQGITTVLTGAFGGLILSKHTGFFPKEGFMIGLAASAALVLATMRMGAIESGEIESGSLEAWILELGSVLTAGLAGKFLGTAFYGAKGGPAGAMIGVTAGLALNLIATIGAKGDDFGNEISDWINVGITTAMTGLTAAKLWQIVGPTVTQAVKGLGPMITTALTTAFGAVATALGVSVGWAVAIVAAIAAAIAGVIYVATHWEEVKNFFLVTIPAWFSSAGATLAAFFTKTVPDWFSGAWEEIQTFFSQTVPDFFTETIPEWFGYVGYGLGFVVGKVARFIVDWWQEDAVPFFTNTIPDFFTKTVPDFFSDAWTWVENFFTKTVPDFIAAVWKDAQAFVTNTVPNFFTEKVPEWIAGGWAWLTDFFTVTVPAFFGGVGTTFLEIGKNLIEGLWNGIKGGWDWFIGLILGFVDNVIQGFKDAFGVSSPSTIFAEIGRFLIEGLWQGIKDAAAWVAEKLRGWVSDFMKKVRGFFGVDSAATIFAEIGDFLVDDLWNGMKNAYGTLKTNVQGWLNDFLGIFKDFDFSETISGAWDWLSDTFETGKTKTMEFVVAPKNNAAQWWSDVQKWWGEKVGAVKDFTTKAANNASTWWSDVSKWWSEKVGSVQNFKTNVSNSSGTWWSDTKKWWSEKVGSVQNFKTNVSNGSKTWWSDTKKWWSEKVGAVKKFTTSPSNGSKTWWSDVKKWWKDKVGAVKKFSTGPSNSSKTWWSNVKRWWKDKVGSVASFSVNVKNNASTWWSNVKKWWSAKAGSLSTKLNIKVPTIKVKWDEISALGKTFKYPTSFSIKYAAQGGIFDAGSLIWAGEHGAEVVANASGGRTGVMNVQQMQDAVYEGVYAALMAAMRSGDDESTPAFNIYLDGRQVTAVVEKRQRERGANILGNAVYSR